MGNCCNQPHHHPADTLPTASKYRAVNTMAAPTHLHDDDTIPTEISALSSAEMVGDSMRTPIRILQMDCPTEEALIRKQLANLPSVQQLEFNLMQRVLTVVHTPDALTSILAAIRTLGFEPEIATTTRQAMATDRPKPWWPLAVAGIAAIASEATDWLGFPGAIPALLAMMAVLLSGIGTYKKGWIALCNKSLNINALMSIAVTGALLLQQWPEAAMVMVLFTIAEWIEAKSLDRARHAIGNLMKLAPEVATVQQADGTWRTMRLSDVTIGQLIRVKPGERIGLDGEIVQGQSTINQAPITGESLPVEKSMGDLVFAGTLNQSGGFDYRVTALVTNSTLARIIHAVEAAQSTKAPTQRFVDQFARLYTPIVFVLAVGIAIFPPLFIGTSWHDWIYKALVLLVIACPCALVISTPVTIVSGLAAAARQGILIKGGAYLESGRLLKWLALDKTGTITHGKPTQTDALAYGHTPLAVCRQLAASLAAQSDHPVSQAISLQASEDAIPVLAVQAFEAIPGQGISGELNGKRYYLGNHRLVHAKNHCDTKLEAQIEILEQAGKTVVVLFDEILVLALFAVADTIKATSREAIASLHAEGVKTAMLTGDNPHTAAAIAKQVGIDQFYGNQLPTDKLAIVEQFGKAGLVGMVGDGINDAPALARADIGFAMGVMGTDTAIETADVALMDDDLRKVATFVRLSRTTHTILRQNIALALGIKTIFLLLTIAGMGSMWMAVFADVGASLLVVGNGLRLLRH